MTARRYDIDALRAIVFAIVILYHICMLYVAQWHFHIKSAYTQHDVVDDTNNDRKQTPFGTFSSTAWTSGTTLAPSTISCLVIGALRAMCITALSSVVLM